MAGRLIEEHEGLVWTFDQAAEAVGVTPRHLRNLVRDQKGPETIRLGRRVMVRRETLANWLKALEGGQAA